MVAVWWIGFAKHVPILTAETVEKKRPEEKKKIVTWEAGRTVTGDVRHEYAAVGYFQEFDPLSADPAEWGADAAHDGQSETDAQLRTVEDSGLYADRRTEAAGCDEELQVSLLFIYFGIVT